MGQDSGLGSVHPLSTLNIFAQASSQAKSLQLSYLLSLFFFPFILSLKKSTGDGKGMTGAGVEWHWKLLVPDLHAWRLCTSGRWVA